MILLITFAFLAGLITVLSPCILPILPIILSSSIGGKNTGKSRPAGVVLGFILSFTFFTLFLSFIVNLSDVPADSLRLFSVIIIAAFGISYLIPAFQIFLERQFTFLARFMPKGNTKSGFFPGLIIGLSVGLLWTPCVGPILASVISLAITGTVTYTAFIITLAYSIGTAIPMFAIMIGGQKLLHKIPWLLANTGNIQKAFGVIMILTAIAIFNNYDRKFQTYILEVFPNYGAGLTQLEDNARVSNELDKLNNNKSIDTINNNVIGKPSNNIQPKGPQAPELIPGGEWFNTKPLTLEQLKGKVVIIDFWTYSCINCQRTLPYLRNWHEKYSGKGLVIIGVHSPEFEFEKNVNNVAQAIKDFGIKYPVVQDNNFSTWKAYSNRYWPAKYFIDKEGYIRSQHFGEGAYDESEKIIQELLKETGAVDLPSEINNPSYQIDAGTPEIYLGYTRIGNFVSPETIQRDEVNTYSAPQKIENNQMAFQGNWKITGEYANPQKGAKLFLKFESKKVFLVMRKTADPAKIKVYLDDKLQYFGTDNIGGIITVIGDKLYELIDLPSPGIHNLRLEFEDGNAQLFAFTFG